MSPRRQSIELERRFVELDPDSRAAEDADSSGRYAVHVGWPELIKHACVVVLGEAGSGKTTEFELRCRLLARGGTRAFYVTVEDVAESGLDGTFSPTEQEAVDSWKTSTDYAYFFLDAVDEARLSGHRFGGALRYVERALRGAMARAHVLISCRVSDWRPDGDLDDVTRRLFPELEKGMASPVKVYAIAPLDDAQVRTLAGSFQVQDPERFVKEARRATASVYLERPRDVEWLVGYWKQHGNFGTLTELIENDVREKLIERNPDRTPTLSAAKAKKAAEVVAGMATLQRKLTLRLPDVSLDPERAATALDPARVLPDMSRPELDELLTLALFDAATYGRVRIHHRSVTEYLAAEWLHALLDAGLEPTELDALLFRKGPDGPVLPVELGPVAAWLAADLEWVRNRLLQVAPWVLLTGGDPNRLPDESRRALLLSLAGRYVDRQRLHIRFDHAIVGRLASGGVVDTVKELLRTSTNVELLDLLLTVVSEGKLTGCADETLKIATNPTAASVVRSNAIEALASVASDAHVQALLSTLLDAADAIDQHVAGAIVEKLHPRWLTTDRLIALITKAQDPGSGRFTLLQHYLGEKVFQDAPPDDRRRLMQATLDLVRVEDEPKRARNTWLLDPLAHMAAEAAADPSGVGLEAILPVLRFFAGLARGAELEPGLGQEEIRKLVAEHAEVRRLLFWDDVVATAASKKEPVRSYSDLLGTERLWHLTADDAQWLAEDARSRPHVGERLLAFDCLLQGMPIREGTAATRERLLADLASHDEAIRKKLQRHTSRATGNPSEPVSMRRYRVHETKKRRQDEENAGWLHENLEQVRDGSNQRALVTLALQVKLDPDDPEAALGRLAEKYDQTVADATRDGWCRLWKHVRCKLPHEEEKRNTFDYSVVVGLAGLALDIAAGLDLAALTPAEARDAVRYASRGMNHFPTWLERLAAVQGAAVREIFGECITADYELTSADPPAHAVLHLLSYADAIVRELCWGTVADLLTRSDPQRMDTLRNCVQLVLATPTSHAGVAPMIPSRCRAARGSQERYALWWSLWLALDPLAAVSELETAIQKAEVSADEVVLAICEALYRLGEGARIGFPLPRDPDSLVALVTILFRHIRPDDDLEHEGTYSPGPRDHAQDLRYRLLERLAATPGEPVYHGLLAFAGAPHLSHSRDMFLVLAERRLAQDAGKREPDVAERLVQACEAYGLTAIYHLEEVGLTTMTTAVADFGIITALPEERDAVLAQLDGYRELDKDGSDTSTYYEAIVQTRRQDGARYRVIVVCCPGYGPEIAVATAAAMLTRWRPRHLMLVGIALGLKGEASHGDVMVADQVADYLLGKKEGGKKRITNWKGHLAGASLFESARALGPAWVEAIKTKRPGEGAPKVVVGTVASGGDVVLDDELLAEFRSMWLKLVGVEMESGGTATAAHHRVNKPEFLMIKAVSDHGKDKQEAEVLLWREYAFGVAAAFAIELLRRGPVPALKG
jgi:nucleoside phosphorylase